MKNLIIFKTKEKKMKDKFSLVSLKIKYILPIISIFVFALSPVYVPLICSLNNLCSWDFMYFAFLTLVSLPYSIGISGILVCLYYEEKRMINITYECRI